VGGIIECVALNVPVGVGEPIFDSLDAEIAKLLFDIPAVKGVEFGAGFEAARLKGSENNDSYLLKDGEIETLTNRAGGVLGGFIWNAPCDQSCYEADALDTKKQKTVDLLTMEDTTIQIKGRHDPCVVPKAVPVVEALVAVGLVDQMLCGSFIPKVLGVETVGEYSGVKEED